MTEEEKIINLKKYRLQKSGIDADETVTITSYDFIETVKANIIKCCPFLTPKEAAMIGLAIGESWADFVKNNENHNENQNK